MSEKQAVAALSRVGRGLSFWRGELCSLFLHGLVLALILFFFQQQPPPLPVADQTVVVEMVEAGEATASPAHPDKAPVPQEQGGDSAKPVRPSSAPVASQSAEKKVVPAKREGVRQYAPPSDDFDAQLRAAARSLPSGRSGPGIADRSVQSDKGALADEAAYSVKDAIGSQIIRHWNFNVASLAKERWVVRVHLQLAADGTVTQADMVVDPRYRTDPTYLALIRSARNAALASSPLLLPAGLPMEKRDMVVEFDPRTALR